MTGRMNATASATTTSSTKEGAWMGEGYVKNEDISTGKMGRELRGNEGLEKHLYMRVNVDLIKGVLEEVMVNIVEKKKGDEDEKRKRNSRKEDRWLRKWYKRMG